MIQKPFRRTHYIKFINLGWFEMNFLGLTVMYSLVYRFKNGYITQVSRMLDSEWSVTNFTNILN